MKKLILFVCVWLPVSWATAQLSLAPTAVFLDKNGIGSLFITNGSGVPQEITIGFQFGYSDQDENGVLIMVYDDSLNAPNHSLDKYVKAFPRAFILPPNQQQIVRFQARVPKDLKPGTYFSRIKVASSGQTSDVGTEGTDANGITTKVNLRFEQVIVCFYKHANVNTGLVIERFQNSTENGILNMDLFYRTTGNSPYIGKVNGVLSGPDGKMVAEFSQTVALYFSSKRRFRIALPEDYKKGNYTVEYTFSTDRADITAEDLIQAPPVKYKASFRLD